MRYVAFLRGINVGGKNKVSMQELRSVVAASGFENVKTYVNSGNVIFDARKDSNPAIAKRIHGALKENLGLDITVMVRSIDELKAVIKNNPFDGQFESHKDLHVFFLEKPLSTENLELLLGKSSEQELISVVGQTVYHLLRISIIDSVLGKGFLDKKLKVPATARNWRTVQKVAEM